MDILIYWLAKHFFQMLRPFLHALNEEKGSANKNDEDRIRSVFYLQKLSEKIASFSWEYNIIFVLPYDLAKK